MNPGQNEDLENEQKRLSEEPIKDLDRLENLNDLMEKQNNAVLLLTGKLVEMTNKLEELGVHQDQSDAAIIEVAKKVGAGGAGGGGGGGGLLAQIIPLISQPRGPGPLEKMAMNSFMRNMAFASLTTERIAKKQFGDEYTKMVKEMEGELSGPKES